MKITVSGGALLLLVAISAPATSWAKRVPVRGTFEGGVPDSVAAEDDEYWMRALQTMADSLLFPPLPDTGSIPAAFPATTAPPFPAPPTPPPPMTPPPTAAPITTPPPTVCSMQCSNNFGFGCMGFHCQSSTVSEAYGICRSEIERAVGPLAEVCVPGCLATDEMRMCPGSAEMAPTPAPPTPAPPTPAPPTPAPPTPAPPTPAPPTPAPAPVAPPAPQPEDIVVNWVIPFPDPELPPVTARVGDTLVFEWDGPLPHNVQLNPAKSCDFAGGIQLGEVSPVRVTIAAEDAGRDLTFVCTVPGHCLSGQILTVTVPDLDGEAEQFSSSFLVRNRRLGRRHRWSR